MSTQSEDQRLIAQYLANGGTICPPRTYAIQEIVTWRDQVGADWRKRMAKNSPFAASRNSIASGDLFELVGKHGVAATVGITGMSQKAVRERMAKAGVNEAFLRSQEWDA